MEWMSSRIRLPSLGQFENWTFFSLGEFGLNVIHKGLFALLVLYDLDAGMQGRCLEIDLGGWL